MFKKFLSIALASIMTMALVVPAFAAEDFTTTDVSNGDDPEPIEVEAGFADYTLKIAIGGGSALILNPYQLTYDASSFTGGREDLGDDETDQIISNETTIVSLSDVPVRMYAKTKGAFAGTTTAEFTDDSNPPDINTKEKRVHLFWEIISPSAVAKLEGDDDPNTYTDYRTVSDNPNNSGYDNKRNQRIVRLTETENWMENPVMIFEPVGTSAAELANANADDNTDNGCAGTFKFRGWMTKRPEAPWNSETDNVTVTMTFAFTNLNNTIS